MAATIGRKIKLLMNGVPLAGLRTKNPKFNKEPIDTTDDNSNGWRELLPEPGQRDVSIPVSGIVKDKTLMKHFFAGNVLHNVVLQYQDTGETITGSFFMGSLSNSMEYNGGVTFETELMSSGEVVYDNASD